MTQSPWRPCTASRPLCRSGESTPHHPCLCRGAAAVAPPHRVCPRLLGSQVPLARSQKAPPPEVHAVVSHAASPAGVHILRCQLTSGLTTGALAGSTTRVNHLNFENRRV
jgi:hypothetical protein